MLPLLFLLIPFLFGSLGFTGLAGCVESVFGFSFHFSKTKRFFKISECPKVVNVSLLK